MSPPGHAIDTQGPLTWEGTLDIDSEIGMLPGETFSLEIREHRKRWIFPKDRFIEYGPEDVWWAEKVDFGQWAIGIVITRLARCVALAMGRDGCRFEVRGDYSVEWP